MLSYDGDPRITSWGATIQKWRWMSFPPVFQCIKGDMSLVGPRHRQEVFYRSNHGEKLRTINIY